MMPNFSEIYENRRVLMIGGGGLGSILGDIGGLIGGLVAPELLPAFIPAAIGAAGGAELGGTFGGLIGGEKPGQAALGALPGAAVAGIGTGVANVAEGAGFFGDVTPLSGISTLFGGAGTTPGAAGAVAAPAAPTAGSGLGAATPAPGASAVPSGGALGAGVSPASAALGGGGISPAGDLAGPAGLPAGTPNVNLGLTDQSVGPGVIGGGDSAATLPSSGSGQDPAALGLGSFNAAGAPVNVTSPLGDPTVTDFSGGAAGGGGAGGFLGKLASNPGALIGAGGLGLAALRQNQPLPDQTQLNQIGAQAQATGNQLASYVNTGTLPPGAQESVNLATNSAKAQVRSTAARLGLSGSTWEADRMGQIDQQAAAQSEQIAQQLLQQGANYSQLSTGVFENLMKSTLTQDEDFQRALSTFAAGLAGAKTSGG